MTPTQQPPTARPLFGPRRIVPDRAATRRTAPQRRTAAIAAIACAAAAGTVVLVGSAQAAAAAPAAAAATAIKVYGAVDDAQASTKYPTANFGTRTLVAAGGYAGGQNIIFAKFVVNSLPAGATGISAQLRFYRNGGAMPALEGSVVANTAWSERTLTYANRPSRGPGIGIQTPAAGATYVAWPVKVTGNRTYAFSVQSPSPNSYAQFNSEEGFSPHPSLNVTYTPPAPQTGKVWIGATCNQPDNSIATFNKCNAIIGPMKFRRSFNSNLPTSFATSSARYDAQNGYRSFVSWKPPGGDVRGAAVGKYDAAIAAWARSVPRTGIYATAYHEPEDNMTGAQFVAMHRRLYTVVKTANSTIQWGPVYMSYWWHPSRLASIGGASAWWVGNDRSDFAGVDTYSTPNPRQLSTDLEFMTWYNFMLKTGKPMVLAEYGQYSVRPGYSVDPAMQARRAQTIAADAAWIRSQGRVKVWLYWHAPGPKGDWSLTDAASRQAWRNAAAAGRQS